jgi:Pyruvate/2-oxoacid:ferredoxin oxidoreductase delta subunit
MRECPERALRVEKVGEKRFRVRIATEYCLGTACKNCETVCSESAMHFSDLKIVKRDV